MEIADPGLTIAIALLAGLLAQTAAHHLRLPGIVLLLATGALLGPDVLRVVNPDSVRPALPYLVSFAVAVILFEGGMNLEIRRLRRASSVIRRLVTVGSVVTLAGATLAAHLALGWAWQLSFLFGVLVIVTGPTVVSPLVRRIRLQKHLRTVLEGEGVLIDPIGAIFAVVILDVLLHPSLASAVSGFLEIAAGLGLGALFGFAAGHLLATVLRWRGLIPESLENVFVLSAVLALFYASNELVAESGLAAVAVAGIVVGNVHKLVQRDLAEFKEQLTMLFIGMLFVLLAADIRFVELEALGIGGLITVAALILIVRPVGVAICAAGSNLKFKEQVFMAWMAPRGVVAAAVASFFALRMDAAGFVGGSALQAMVFLVIAITVTVDGLTGGIVGTLLGVRLPRPQGWLIVGAGPLGRMLGRTLRDAGQPVTFLDSGTSECHDAEEEDFPVIFGNALEESTLLRADPERFIGCIAVTPNEEINFLVASRVHEGFDLAEVWAAIQARNGNLTRDMIHSIDASLLFAGQKASGGLGRQGAQRRRGGGMLGIPPAAHY
ncbi:MAG: cation:proton antiporter [Gammaproteobacteria bacterium]